MNSISLITKFRAFVIKRPLTKGVIAYGLLWPTGSLIQQSIEGRRFDTYDWKRCIRFSLYGGLFVAPTLYAWIKFTSVMWPKTNLKSGLAKAFVDQLAYGPFSMVCFYIGMTLLEFKTFNQACNELKSKFFPTYKVAICVWPILQTINFSLVPERNRVIFVSLCSVVWTTFLAYMKQLEEENHNENQQISNS